MKHRILILALTLVTIFTVQSCKKVCEEPEPNRENDLQIRFSNIGQDKVKHFNFNGIQIGNLSVGETTRYYSFDPITVSAYNSPLVDAHARNDGHQIEYFSYSSDDNTVLTQGKHTMNVQLYMFCGIGLGLTLAE